MFEADRVSGHRAEISEQGTKTVNRESLLGPLGLGLGKGLLGPFCWCHHREAGSLGLVSVFVLKQKGSQGSSHVPLHVIGEHAEEDVGFHPVGQSVVDGADVEIDGFQCPKGPLHHGESLV